MSLFSGDKEQNFDRKKKKLNIEFAKVEASKDQSLGFNRKSDEIKDLHDDSSLELETAKQLLDKVQDKLDKIIKAKIEAKDVKRYQELAKKEETGTVMSDAEYDEYEELEEMIKAEAQDEVFEALKTIIEVKIEVILPHIWSVVPRKADEKFVKDVTDDYVMREIKKGKTLEEAIKSLESNDLLADEIKATIKAQV